LVLLIIGAAFGLELLCWFRFDRMIRSLGAGRGPRALWSLFMAGNVLALLWVVLGRRFLPHPEDFLPRWALAATFVWHLLLLPLTLVIWMIASTGRGVAVLTRGKFSRPLETTDPETDAVPPEPSTGPDRGTTRRQFLGVAVATAPPLVTALTTGVSAVQLAGFRVRPVTLALPQLPPDLDGMTIAHVSDIHVGRFTQGKVLSKIVEATNNLRADLVLLSGDLINMELADLPAALDVVRRMDSRSGVYLCEGNHDLIESRAEFERRTRASGVPLLVNESTLVPVRGRRVQLLGLRWGTGAPSGNRTTERGDAAIAASMRSLLPQLRRDAEDVFPILLAHHPHAFDPAAAAGIPLTLSGHTHGGQLMLSPRVGFGPWMYRYWSGAYRKGDSSLVVSNGVGNWFPLRVGAPAEIIHLTLRRG
jgi:hypothetical protein